MPTTPASKCTPCSFDDNIDKLLAALEGCTNRKADFRTVICLIEQGVPRYFEGRVDGVILTERYGDEGFGYDPVFMPDRFAVSFAEMPLEVKNQISHRGLAVKQLTDYLKTKKQYQTIKTAAENNS